jgi:hypothetical protein
LTLIAVGLVTALALLPGPLTFAGGLTLDVHTLLVACTCCVVGVQSVCFAVIARDYAVARKLIPSSGRFRPFASSLTLERMLLLGGALVAVGLFRLAWAFWQWSEVNFGDLVYGRVLREVMVSLTAHATGAELMLSGFLAGVIAIGHRD